MSGRPIFINGRFLGQRVTGVQRSGRAVLRALDAMMTEPSGPLAGRELEVLVPSTVNGGHGLAHLPVRRVGISRGHLWEQTELAARARRGALLSLCNTAPMILSRQVAVLHDASMFAVPEAYSAAFRNWYNIMFRGVAARAGAVATDSRFSRDELVRFGLADAGRIHVVYLGAEHILETPADERILERLPRGRRYVLAVGSEAAHKNLAVLARMMAADPAADYDLVIAGHTDPRIFGAAAATASARTIRLGYVSDAELRALYEHAVCHVYPSRYEGFGLPPLEAMACGCPVVVSRAASLPEVCGDAALYCDPADAAGFAAAVRRILEDAALRAELVTLGLAQAARFRWRDAARHLVTLVAEQAAR